MQVEESTVPRIRDLVKAKLTFLTDAQLQRVDEVKLELFYLLQKQTGKRDSEVEEESNYSRMQLYFFADYVAYQLLQEYLRAKATGKAGEESAPVATYLKKAKADVVEAEFEAVKPGSAGLSVSTEAVFADLKSAVCAKARVLGYSVDICHDPSVVLTPAPFIFAGTPYVRQL